MITERQSNLRVNTRIRARILYISLRLEVAGALNGSVNLVTVTPTVVQCQVYMTFQPCDSIQSSRCAYQPLTTPAKRINCAQYTTRVITEAELLHKTTVQHNGVVILLFLSKSWPRLKHFQEFVLHSFSLSVLHWVSLVTTVSENGSNEQTLT